MRVRRVLSSCRLGCGCLAGIYETYNGPAVTIIDDRGATCAHPEHQPGRPVTVGDESPGASPPDQDRRLTTF
jgi:hypothetical protein